MYEYKYPKADVTADCVLFAIIEKELKILLVKRNDPEQPFCNHYALPGGFLEMELDETLKDTASRELVEETGVEFNYLEQLGTFSKVGRDPRGRVITVAYIGLTNDPKFELTPDMVETSAVTWFNVDQLPQLAFDHADIVKVGLERLRGKIEYTSVVFNLLPENFTLTEVMELYEIIWNKKLDKGNFHNKLKSSGVVVATDLSKKTEGKPSKLYTLTNEQKERKRKLLI